MAVDYIYAIGEPVWSNLGVIGSGWTAPTTAKGWIDMRGLPACGEQGTTNIGRHVGLFWYDPLDMASIPASQEKLNQVGMDCRNTVTQSELNAMITKFQAKLGFTPADIDGTLAGLVLDCFTNKSNPEASDVVPTLEGETIHFTGHSPVSTLPSSWKTDIGFKAYADRLLQRQRGKVRAWMDLEDAGALPAGSAMKALGGLLWKEGVRTDSGRRDQATVDRFVHPADRARVRSMGGAARPDTLITDDFNRADTTDLTPTWLNARASGDLNWSIVSNKLKHSGNHPSAQESKGYHSTPLSLDDHYAEIEGDGHSSAEFYGAMVRYTPSGTRSQYAASHWPFGSLSLFKEVSAVLTQLSTVVQSYVSPGRIKLDFAGSNYQVIYNDTAVITSTDSSIATGLYAGARLWDNTSTLVYNYDNFAASDGVSGGGGGNGKSGKGKGGKSGDNGGGGNGQGKKIIPTIGRSYYDHNDSIWFLEDE